MGLTKSRHTKFVADSNKHNLKITVALITKGCEPKRGNGVIPYMNYIGTCSPKLHVEVNGFGLKKKRAGRFNV